METEQRVYVVMGNDFPEAVFASREAADRFCADREREHVKGQVRIHWRAYDFKVNKCAK